MTPHIRVTKMVLDSVITIIEENRFSYNSVTFDNIIDIDRLHLFSKKI